MNSSILDVAIGIVFFYASLSLAVTTITEYVSRRTKLRTKKLEQGLAALLQSTASDSVLDAVVEKIMTHPLVAPKAIRGANGRPTEIAPKAFATALFDIIREGKATTTLADLQSSVKALPEGDAKKVLMTVIEAAGNDLERAREIVAKWFDDGMKWVSGWYRRAVQLITRWSAAILVITLNADTTVIVQTMWTDQALRQSIAAMATATAATAEPQPTGAPRPPDRLAELRQQTEAALHPFPIGWTLEAGDPRAPEGWHEGGMKLVVGILRKLFGLFLTAVALAIGGPFWFDILKRMVNLRGEIIRR